MSCYEALAAYYDRLTADVDYRSFADRYESAFAADGGPFHLLLDLCCGTGSMSLEMSRRGYELISVDASEQMLMERAAGSTPAAAPLLCSSGGPVPVRPARTGLPGESGR